MNHIRPHKVFNLLDENDRMASISLPFKHSVTSMLERGILISLYKIAQPRTVFEFGTYLGEMTRMFSENSPAHIFTLDLGDKFSSDKLDGHEKKNLSKSLQQKKLFHDHNLQERITELFGDSTSFDFTHYAGKMDFILIDGGHHIDVVRSDTENAFKMLSSQSMACIVWHDYGNPSYEITDYLDKISKEKMLYHVEETQYVFFFNNSLEKQKQLFN